MHTTPTLLCFSHDQMLLETRTAVLARSYQVIPASTLNEMKALLVSREFDLVVLCHSVKGQEREDARRLINQQWPDTKVLSMSKRSEMGQQDEVIVRGMDGPVALLERIRALLYPTF